MAILYSDLLRGTVHHPIKFQADCKNHVRGRAVTSFFIPAIFNRDILHCNVHHPTTFQTDNYFFYRVRAVTSVLRPASSLSWEISKFRGTHKNWSSIATVNSDMLHGTVYHPTLFQADSRNPEIIRVVTSFGTDRGTDGRTSGRKDRWQ